MIQPKYYLVERTLLPEIFQRVIEANEAIASGKAATASEAAKLAGVLSSILGLMARSGANLLTVNQSIPMRGQASVTIAARTGGMKYSVEELMHRAEALEGVGKVEILASE